MKIKVRKCNFNTPTKMIENGKHCNEKYVSKYFKLAGKQFLILPKAELIVLKMLRVPQNNFQSLNMFLLYKPQL